MSNLMKSGKSTHSIVHINQRKPTTESEISDAGPPMIFDHFDIIEENVNFSEVMVTVLGHYECHLSVVVDNVLDVYQEVKRGRSKIRQKKIQMVKTMSSDRTVSKMVSPKDAGVLDESTLVITASHDINNRLVEVSINKYKYCTIPRVIMRCLKHILPNYMKLNTFKITDCAINKFTIFELKTLLCRANITEVCLDSTFLPEGNYDLLLEEGTSIKHLSLSRCKINDVVCKQIFSRLDLSKPAEKLLLTLNLSSNRITDAGAESAAVVLRTNRHLRYLNLSDNQITDNGASYILNVLKEFPLTCDEIMHKRSRYLNYLQNKRVIYNKCIQDFENMSYDKLHVENNLKKTIKKRRTGPTVTNKIEKQRVSDEFIFTKAELMTLELMGPFDHPFDKAHVITKDGYLYCHGNLILCYLNLAYNNLMYPSVKKLLDVLECQRAYVDNTNCGLMKVVLAGNNLPQSCAELSSVTDILTGRIIRSYTGARHSARIQVKGTDKKLKSSSAL